MPEARRVTNSIAGRLTPDDWQACKANLAIGGAPELWALTFEAFFMQRLNLRYLNPIEVLQDEGNFQGEGFSIVTIQCALIEFMAATRKGQNYRHIRRGDRLGPHEYSNSSKLFQEFLVSASPFNEWFNNATARDFYASVRCALLHEARTRNDWVVWASGEIGVDTERKIVFRNELQKGIRDYITAYGIALVSDEALQASFIRKFDHLAT